MQTPGKLTTATFRQAVFQLAEKDKNLKIIITKFGLPPFWKRNPGFPTLIYIILEQQVSLASARAAYNKLAKIVQPLTPQNFSKLNAAELKAIGFSRQKTEYGRILANAILEGCLDLSMLNRLADSQAKEKLISIKGIGSWTADIYLLLAMLRPDIWPGSDLAIALAIQRLKKMPARPSLKELLELSLPWQPWRSVAARMLWHFYLSSNGNNDF
jgi:DNA-3-methyladenine glycosylase II